MGHALEGVVPSSSSSQQPNMWKCAGSAGGFSVIGWCLCHTLGEHTETVKMMQSCSSVPEGM